MARKHREKRSQWIMIWLYPLIAIGGLFYPLLGYLMLVMMVFLLIYSYFKSRYWCGNLCPRGAFLDIFMPHVTLNRSYPRIITRRWFRWGIFGLFMSIFVARMMATGGNLVAIGGIFVSMCVVTSLIAIPLGIVTRPRAWCAFCPMGTLQETLGKLGQNHTKAKRNFSRLPSSSQKNSSD
ncbi:MAG: 4Fe-4S binding protein [Cylindrospermopsis raciborskii KL1]|jgi:ferredoxin-type protein NapH|uniref:4Fe-4S binding protein n=1 Tax=Cylindrospermopsis raciborskii TaxID=77022 RepID=UPI001A1CB6F3|nr:4Fe-4S binding protein [Cylindrospermopsis raciborskii]MBG0742424.1 4Fe-4S binding protein [Cylindrospermopsis raciborskii KL1]